MNHWRYLYRKIAAHRRRFIIAVLCTTGVTVLGLLPPLLFGRLLELTIRQQRYEWLVWILLAMALEPFASSVVGAVGDYFTALLGQRLVFDIRLDLYRRVQQLSCRYMQRMTTGKVMERLRGDVAQLQQILNAHVLTMLRDVLMGVVALVVMFFVSWPLAFVVMLAGAFYIFNYRWFILRIRKKQRRYRRKMDNLSTLAHERLTAAALVKSLNQQQHETRRFTRSAFKTARLFHVFRMLNAGHSQVSIGIMWLSYALVMCLGVALVLVGYMSLGAVITCVLYTRQMLRPAVMLSEISNQLQQVKVSMDRIFALMDGEVDALVRGGARRRTLVGAVAFESVGFGYRRDRPVLEDIHLSVEPGQTIALIGRTGCGKSTMARLIYGFYAPGAGRILVDGVDLQSLDAGWYRRFLAMVPQEPIVFDTSIAENIAFGMPEPDQDRIEQAARVAGLDKMLQKMPDGLQTPLGEFGSILSMGEKQRICLARAMVMDPRILILDEATSSLDPHSEALIQPALRQAMAGRTCFIIAHRLSTIMDADRIVVLDHGRIIEQGDHAGLMSDPQGVYRRMFLRQASALGPDAVKGVA